MYQSYPYKPASTKVISEIGENPIMITQGLDAEKSVYPDHI
jgi:hypothetical protein